MNTFHNQTLTNRRWLPVIRATIQGVFIWFLFLNISWVFNRSHVPNNTLLSSGSSDRSLHFEEVDIKGGEVSSPTTHPIPANCTNVLVVHEYIPYADHHGADSRLLDILVSLVSICSQVKFVSYVCLLGPGNTEKWELPRSIHIAALRKLGVIVDCTVGNGGITQALVDIMVDFEPTVILASLWFWTWPTRPLYASLVLGAHQQILMQDPQHNARFVLLSDDVHGDRESKQLTSVLSPIKNTDTIMDMTSTTTRLLIGKEIKSNLLQSTEERVSLIRSMEHSAYSCADIVVAITPEDASRMREIVSGSNVLTVRPTASLLKSNSTGFDKRFGFLFVGTGQNPTNVVAIQWFVAEVWPLIRRQLPYARFLIAGSLPPNRIWAPELRTKSLCDQLGVSVLGFSKNLESVVSIARVFVSPVRVSSGFNTKNLIALTSGIPLITTLQGATGLPPHAAIITGRSPEFEAAHFAEACVRVYSDAAIWEQQRASGLSVARSFFSPRAVELELRTVLSTLANHDTPRKCNVFLAPFVLMLTHP